MSFAPFVTLLQDLDGISSTTQKKEILAQHLNQPNVIKLLTMAMSAYVTFGVKNFEMPPSYSQPGRDEEPFFTLAEQLRTRKLTGSDARMSITSVLSLYDATTAEALARVLLQDLKVSVGISLVNKAAGKDVIEEYSVQLADKMSAKFDWDAGPYFVEYKYDGMRLVANWVPEDPNTITYRSRDGRIQENVPQHITDGLLLSVKQVQAFPNNQVWAAGINFDGEIISQSDDGKESYHDTMSMMKSKKTKDRGNLRYRMFDIIPQSAWLDQQYDKQFMDRRKDVEASCHGKHIVPSVGEMCYTREDIERVYNDLLQVGAEGAIIKKPKHKYLWKRNRDWTKLKPVYTADLECYAIYEGDALNGFKGTLGGLKLRGKLEDGTYVECDCGSGFKVLPSTSANRQPTRGEIFADPDLVIGNTIEVEYQEVTTAKSKDVASLRFVIFKGIRTDK